MKLRRCLSLIRIGIMENLQWRLSIIITFLGNIVYLVIIYSLWNAIYASSPADTVNGMTFTDTMVYLVLAMTIFNILNLYIVWEMGRDIQSGQMIINLIRPMEFRSYMFFSSLGGNIVHFFMVFIPTFIIVNIITGGAIPIGLNLVFFLPALIFALIIYYFIDFLIGTVCLYTESTWGINIAKEVTVLLLSGAMIPIAFFPDGLKTVAAYLPFQAIYNVPLRILTERDLSVQERFFMLGVQLIWVAVFYIASGLFWKKSIKVITVNGG
ncbi:MAG: ABC-2 family transporter protein [Oscillospiraceae bacterium]|nr:ABC-2 family transporter protein [Oscillospiraceae bacterium]